MKIKLKTTIEFDIKYLQVEAGVRYWEDSELNGISDEEGLMPCKDGEYWKPLIDIENGIIVNWENGNKAEIHYKVCDDGKYSLLDKEKKIVTELQGIYVPKILCPKENGYGDYIIMDINEYGVITDWEILLSDLII